MLNIDSEEEGYLLVGCAGGALAEVSLPLKRFLAEGRRAILKIDGLAGGHSGVEIDKGRANACKLMGRTLYRLQKEFSILVVSLEGGQKDNAIPREAQAEILIDRGADTDALLKSVEQMQKIYRQEYRKGEETIHLSLTVSQEPETAEAFTPENGRSVVAALAGLPDGIQKMSSDIQGLVQTSLNMGVVRTGSDRMTFLLAVRSSVETEKQELLDRIACLTEALGGGVSLTGVYPAWEYREDSMLRKLMVSVFEKMYGRKPVVQALHAGVECGIFSGKMPGLDCVSFGPDMKDIHTPRESMDVESVRRTWEYMLEVLRGLR